MLSELKRWCSTTGNSAGRFAVSRVENHRRSTMKQFLTKRYRPERHYMRGPGPMWLKKHGGGIAVVGFVIDDNRGDSHLLNFYSQLARRWRD
jgi:hypothetical protein